MTSDATDAPTKDYFREHNYFGLDPKDVFFFEQEMLPCVTPGGKIIMESKCKVSRAPNGNGGLYYGIVMPWFICCSSAQVGGFGGHGKEGSSACVSVLR